MTIRPADLPIDFCVTPPRRPTSQRATVLHLRPWIIAGRTQFSLWQPDLAFLATPTPQPSLPRLFQPSSRDCGQCWSPPWSAVLVGNGIKVWTTVATKQMVTLIEEKIKEKRFHNSELLKQSLKLEEALAAARKLTSQRQSRLSMLHISYRQAQEFAESLQSSEQELQSLVDLED